MFNEMLYISFPSVVDFVCLNYLLDFILKFSTVIIKKGNAAPVFGNVILRI